jgi:hypothetical protein
LPSSQASQASRQTFNKRRFAELDLASLHAEASNNNLIRKNSSTAKRTKKELQKENIVGLHGSHGSNVELFLVELLLSSFALQ